MSKSKIDAVEIGRIAAELGCAAREMLSYGRTPDEDACGAWARVREAASDELIAAACEALCVGAFGAGNFVVVHDGEGAVSIEAASALDFCAAGLGDVLDPSDERRNELLSAIDESAERTENE